MELSPARSILFTTEECTEGKQRNTQLTAKSKACQIAACASLKDNHLIQQLKTLRLRKNLRRGFGSLVAKISLSGHFQF
jgi:hypothetical protein